MTTRRKKCRGKTDVSLKLITSAQNLWGVLVTCCVIFVKKGWTINGHAIEVGRPVTSHVSGSELVLKPHAGLAPVTACVTTIESPPSFFVCVNAANRSLNRVHSMYGAGKSACGEGHPRWRLRQLLHGTDVMKMLSLTEQQGCRPLFCHPSKRGSGSLNDSGNSCQRMTVEKLIKVMWEAHR